MPKIEATKGGWCQRENEKRGDGVEKVVSKVYSDKFLASDD